MSNAEPAPEPTEEEFRAWLATPDGVAAMKQVMQDIVADKHGKHAPEMLEQARVALRKHETAELVRHIKQRLIAWTHRLTEEPHEWPENSRWAHVRALNEEIKAITDLVLELPEPHRSNLMKKITPLQQMVEKVEHKTD